MTLHSELVHDESEALNFEDLKRMLTGRVKNVKAGFVDLEENKDWSMRKLLPSSRNATFVLMTAKVTGRTQRHWGVLIRNHFGFQFFESLGFGYKTIKQIITTPQFVDFLVGHRFKGTTHKLQRGLSKIRTCGLHCIVRLVKYDLNNNQYAHWLKSAGSPDRIVAMLCYIGHRT